MNPAGLRKTSSVFFLLSALFITCFFSSEGFPASELDRLRLRGLESHSGSLICSSSAPLQSREELTPGFIFDELFRPRSCVIRLAYEKPAQRPEWPPLTLIKAHSRLTESMFASVQLPLALLSY